MIKNSVSRLCSMLVAAIALAVMTAGCGGSSGGSTPPAKNPADTIFKNGTVETINGSMASAQAVAVTDGKIVAVGSNAQVSAFKGSSTRVVELNGATLLPGFIDTHSNMMG